MTADQFKALMSDIRKIVYILAAIAGLLIAILWTMHDRAATF
jgi:hypothetical protein